MGGVIFLSLFSLALTIPDHPIGRVHDEAALLLADQRASLESKLAQFESETTNQIVVAIFPSLEGESLEDFSIHLAEKWKIGQKGKDNGIILLIFPKDHLLRIEVGYGLEAVVPDAYASRIIEEKLKPSFRQGNFYEGIDAAIESLMAATRGSYEETPSAGQNLPPWPVFLFFILFLSVFFFAIYSQVRRYGWKKTFLTGAGHTYSGGGGFSSGGGGGFSGGGGSFGGGGSSGSW